MKYKEVGLLMGAFFFYRRAIAVFIIETAGDKDEVF